MKSNPDFNLVGNQILHQLSNDIVAQRGYLELLHAEKVPKSTGQIVHKLQTLGRSHHIHVELYRRAAALQSIIKKSSGVESANMTLALEAAAAASQSLVATRMQVLRQKPLVSVMISQTTLNQIVGFLILLVMDELKPRRSNVKIVFRRRNNYLSTKFSIITSKSIHDSTLTSSGVLFLQAVLKVVDGSLSIQPADNSLSIYVRLPVSKQMKLI